MKTFSAGLFLSAIGATVLSTPSFAQSPYPNGAYSYNGYSYGTNNAAPVGRPLYDVAPGYVGSYSSGMVGVYGGSGAIYNQATTSYSRGGYPNPVSHSGSASSIDSGAAFNLNRGYPAFYEFTGE